MKVVLVAIATIFAIVGNVPYLRDVIKRTIEPHAYTWMVWSIVSAIVFFGQVAKGAGIAALATGASEIFTIIIFIFSLRYGFRHVRPIDTIFLVIALLGLIPWFLTSDPTISVVIAVSIDLIAFVPTLRKTWQNPETETPLLYGMNVLRHGLILSTLGAYNIATMLHSIVMITTNSLMIVFIRRRKRS